MWTEWLPGRAQLPPWDAVMAATTPVETIQRHSRAACR